jgi:uridine kinase
MELPRIVVGIAGGTGSGKTTTAKKIAEALPDGAALRIEYDSYYRDQSVIPPDDRGGLNFDHPGALDTPLLVEHLTALRAGEPVDLPIYDFKTHSRTPECRRAAPAPVIIVEGILTFADEGLRNLFDIKIFVDTDADIRIMRRVRRDIEERGRDFNGIREQYYRTVRPMHIQFVEPSKRWADLVIPEGGANQVALDTIVGKLMYVITNP